MHRMSLTRLNGNKPKVAGFVGADDAASAGRQAGNTLLRKILVVDDEAELADLTAMLLTGNGLEALPAHSAHEAIQILAGDDQIDAVVSDIAMPGMDGLQLADAIRRMYPRVKVVLVSGYVDPSKYAGRERQYLFASKPYSASTILKLLQS